MLIVEGPDGAGKTTLIKAIQKHLPRLSVAPRVVSKEAEQMVDLKAWVEEDVQGGFREVIYDRHRLISEFIYGPILRKEQAPGFSDLYWVHKQMSSLYECEPIIIYCLPPLPYVQRNLEGDPDNLRVVDHVGPIYTSYVQRAISDSLNPELATLIYDYTDDNIATVLKFIQPIIFNQARKKVVSND